MKRFFFSILTAGLGFLFGLTVCALLTPLFWKLEPIFNIELAGHSGPSDWLLLSFAIVFGLFGFSIAWRRVR